MAKIDGVQFKSLLHNMLPSEVINEGARRLGVLKRKRILDPAELVWALIFGGGTEECGRLVAVLRALVEGGLVKEISRSAFYQWFDKEVLALMRELGQKCCAFADAQPKHLPNILSGRKDWRIVDSTVVKVPDTLKSAFPGTGDYGSVKVHKVYSLGCENVIDYVITPGREHDSSQLHLDERWRGTGLIVDLGYASFRLLRQAIEHDVALTIRLKENWRVFLDEKHLDSVKDLVAGGADIASFSPETAIPLDPTKEVDLDITLGPHTAPIPMRLVCFPSKKGRIELLTNLPRSTHSPEQVATLYELRWNIELDNKLCKSAFRLDQVTAKSPISAEVLVHAAMMASIIANAFVHGDHLSRGFEGETCPKLKESPLHAMLAAKMFAANGMLIASMLASDSTPMESWDAMAGRIRHHSLDPNWRRSPSALDRVKKRTAPPGPARAAPKKGFQTSQRLK